MVISSRRLSSSSDDDGKKNLVKNKPNSEYQSGEDQEELKNGERKHEKAHKKHKKKHHRHHKSSEKGVKRRHEERDRSDSDRKRPNQRTNEDSDELVIYCICKSTDVSRFMIGCDNCEDWFHGDCVSVSERIAKYIKSYFCPECRRKNAKLEIVYKSKYVEHVKSLKEKEERQKIRRETEKFSHRDRSDRMTDNDFDNEKERRKRKKHHHHHKKHSKHSKRDKHVDESRDESSSNSEDTSPVDKKIKTEPHQVTPAVLNEKPITNAKSVQQQQQRQPLSNTSSRVVNVQSNTKRSELKEDFSQQPRGGEATQCLGMTCTKPSRIYPKPSKYCSDQCGINLASVRIYQTLPDRLREWSLTECGAEQKNRKDLEKILREQRTVQRRLNELNVEFENLEKAIEIGKCQLLLDDTKNNIETSVHQSNNSSSQDEGGGEGQEAAMNTIFCVTCGAEVQMRVALKHMDKCYNKLEAQTSFASRYRTQIEDKRMFCDNYNRKEGTYCKRLNVLCPEHPSTTWVNERLHEILKKSRNSEEVCGFSLLTKDKLINLTWTASSNQLKNTTSSSRLNFCQRAKRACHLHYGWEKLRRAELDMEKVKQWMKVDELLEQERLIRSGMNDRAGVLGLMLHSTFNHELDNRFVKQKQS